MTSTDTDAAVGRALVVVRDGVAQLTESQWTAPSLCSEWSVKAAIAHLVWRVSAPSAVMVEDIARAVTSRRDLSPSHAISHIAIRIADARSSGELVDDLTLLSRRFGTGDQHGSQARLLETVVHGFDAAHPLGIRLNFDDASTHAVAELARKSAHRDVRTLLRHRTLTASDAGWSIGRGDEEIIGTAESIILYLTGRRSIDPPTLPVRQTAPQRPTSPSPRFA